MGYLQDSMIDYMGMRGYAKRTIKLYTGCVKILANYFKKTPLSLYEDDLYNFMIYLKKSNKSDSTLHIYYESIKFFYSMHDLKDRIPKLDFLRRPVMVPQVLSHTEILNIFNVCKDLRMKTLFFLVYSAGLRLSEVINLDISDIDFDRKTVFVRNGKNKKNRYTLLSSEAEKTLREYLVRYNPVSILFYNSHDHKKRISPSCIQRQFKKLVSKAEISKKVHVHTLRHSFATHLLETGTSIFHIMRILGHAHIQTTMIYLHTQNSDLSRIKSPLDVLLAEANTLRDSDTLFLWTA